MGYIIRRISEPFLTMNRKTCVEFSFSVTMLMLKNSEIMNRHRAIFFVSILTLAVFLSLSLTGPMFFSGMQMNDRGQMTGCVFTGTTLCTMTFSEHLAQLQALFNAIPAKTITLLALALLAFVTFYRSRSLFRDALRLLSIRYRLYLRSNTHLCIRPLQEAFSQGILNPKAY